MKTRFWFSSRRVLMTALFAVPMTIVAACSLLTRGARRQERRGRGRCAPARSLYGQIVLKSF
jgi:hypothetical protein